MWHKHNFALNNQANHSFDIHTLSSQYFVVTLCPRLYWKRLTTKIQTKWKYKYLRSFLYFKLFSESETRVLCTFEIAWDKLIYFEWILDEKRKYPTINCTLLDNNSHFHYFCVVIITFLNVSFEKAWNSIVLPQ